MRRHLQFATLFLAACLAAVAQDARVYREGAEWVEETNGSVTANKMIRIKTTGGSIHLTGGQQGPITYTVRKKCHASSEESARREFNRLKIIASFSGDTTFIRGEGERYWHGSINFDVHVPSQTSLAKLETGGGNVTANGISGRVETSTGGGSVHLDEIGESVSASTGGGNIEVGKIGGDVRVDTGGGTIRILSAGGQIVASSGGGTLYIGDGKVMKLNTGGGSIRVGKCNGGVKASTGGGSIDLQEVTGTAQADSGGGSIRVGPVNGGVKVETGGGPIVADLSASGGAFTESRLETSAGDIIVYIPDDLAVTIKAAVEVANGAGIRSDFPNLKITRGNQQWGPREAYAEGSLNGGGPVLHVHTATGTIEFRRRVRK